MVLNLKLLISTSLLVVKGCVHNFIFKMCAGDRGSKCTYGYVCVALRWIIGQRFYVWEKKVARINDFLEINSGHSNCDFEQVAVKF